MIESTSNRTFKKLQSLLTTRGIQKHGQFLVSGKKAIKALLKTQKHLALFWVVSENKPERTAIPQITLTQKLFETIDIFGTHSPLLLAKTPEIYFWKQEKPKGLILITSLQDPRNLGAALRTAGAFAVQSVVLLEGSSSPFHPQCIRASSGYMLSTPLFYGPKLSTFIKENDSAFALDLQGKSIFKTKLAPNMLLILGIEGRGLPKDHRLQQLNIPQVNTNIDSLNASSALAIFCAEYSRQNYNL